MDRLIIGCGYLGQRVAVEWLARGERVFATTRSPERAAEFSRAGLQPIVCDVLDPSTLGALPEVETVAYAIARDRSSGQSMRDVYVSGLRNVLEALPRIDRFIYVSSTSVYGQTNGESVDESAPTEPREESGKIVLEAEQLLRERLPAAVILRFAGIYGAGRLLRQRAIEAGEPIEGNAEKWLNLIHVADGVAAVLAAGDHSTPGLIYNISDDKPVSRREYYTRLAQLLEALPPQFALPRPGEHTHELAHRRIANQSMHRDLLPTLKYPTYEQGLRAAVRPG